MSSKIQLRRDSAANWTSTNPVLAQGEPGLETDTNKVKYGDGSTAWNLLDYAAGGSGGGDFSTGFEDGVNDNTYHFTTVTGKKEFTFETEGYKLIRITLTAPMIAALSSSSILTFTTTDTPQIADVWFGRNNYGNDIYIYLASEYDANTLNSMFDGTMLNPSTGAFTLNSTNTGLSVGDVIVIKYWSEGSYYSDSDYDGYGYYVPDVSESAASNTITISNAEYWNDLGSSTTPGDAFYDLVDATLMSKHSISFVKDEKNDTRNITAVVDNEDGTYTITFDGTPVQSKTTEAVSFTFTAIDSQTDNWSLNIPYSAYPNFSKEAENLNSTDTNKYTGGTSRSGYLTINGGSPIDFWWYGNNANESAFALNMFNNVTYSQGDTIAVTFYKVATLVDISIYRPNNANYNNGYKWFDWKDDIETEYSPARGNGIQAGRAQMLVVQYRQPVGAWEANQNSMAIQFGWTNNGYYQQDPYDPYRQDDVSNWGYQIDDSYPLYDFDENGIIFRNTSTYGNDFSMTYKVRIIYKFELIIGEDIYNWFNC